MAVSDNQPVSVGNLGAVLDALRGGGLFDSLLYAGAPYSLRDGSLQLVFEWQEYSRIGVWMPYGEYYEIPISAKSFDVKVNGRDFTLTIIKYSTNPHSLSISCADPTSTSICKAIAIK